MQYQIPVPHPPIQGPTIQQTFPVPPVTALERSGYLALDRNRYIVSAPPQIHQGATVMRTDPVPPVSQPVLNYWRPDVNRAIMWEGPDQFFDGATVQQTYIFPPDQPVRARVEGQLQQNRFVVDATKYFDGATIQQTYIFQPYQPEFNGYTNLSRNIRIVETVKRLEGATIQQTYVFQPNQPERFRVESFLQTPRYLVGAIPQFDGVAPAALQTYIFPVGEPDANWTSRQLNQNRFIVPTAPQFGGATVQQTYLFPPNQPELNAFGSLQRARLLGGPLPQFDGTTIQGTFVFPPNQPDRSRVDAAVQSPRFLVGAPLRLDGAGAVIPQTYVFPVVEPEPSWTARQANQNRFVVGAVPFFDGATIQSTDPIPPVLQPNVYTWPGRQQPEVIKRTEGISAAPQTFTFQQDQPNQARYRALPYADATRLFDGATVQATFIFPPSQPSLSMWPGRQYVGTMVQLDQIVSPFALTGLTGTVKSLEHSGTVKTLEHTYSVFSLSSKNTIKILP